MYVYYAGRDINMFYISYFYYLPRDNDYGSADIELDITFMPILLY